MKKYPIRRWFLLLLILAAGGILLTRLVFKTGNGNPAVPGSGLQDTGTPETSLLLDSTVKIPEFMVSRLSVTGWNTPLGLPYSRVPGANLGATSFVVMDESRIAFLCNSSNEIIITARSTGKSINKFGVSPSPRDFVYEKEVFYVLFENRVTEYDINGLELKTFSFPPAFQGVEKLTRSGDASYLLLPSGNSLLIEKAGTPVEPVEYNGIVAGNGQFITTRITGTYTCSLKVLLPDNRIVEKSIGTGKKVAGIFVIGASGNRVLLDIQTFISENPIAVERVVALADLDQKGRMAFVNRSEIPDCYYVLSNKDFYMSVNGEIFNMITTPNGVYVFRLTETKTYDSEGYPSDLADTKYHSNENLIKLD
jgi:hypothetical protein